MDKIKCFVSLDENNLVENCITINYSHKLIEYLDCDELCTKNHPKVGGTFNEELNVFISPKDSWMDDTWTFNMNTFRWDPDPDVIYYHIDNIPHKWNPETEEWYQVNQ
jgi:hypothetical protein